MDGVRTDCAGNILIDGEKFDPKSLGEMLQIASDKGYKLCQKDIACSRCFWPIELSFSAIKRKGMTHFACPHCGHANKMKLKP